MFVFVYILEQTTFIFCGESYTHACHALARSCLASRPLMYGGNFGLCLCFSGRKGPLLPFGRVLFLRFLKFKAVVLTLGLALEDGLLDGELQVPKL